MTERIDIEHDHGAGHGRGAAGMSREVQAVVLVLIGGAVLRISVTDVFLRYVKAQMQPFLVVSGVILIVLGLLLVRDVLREGRGLASASEGTPQPSDKGTAETGSDQPPGDPSPVADQVHVHDPDHGHDAPRVAWLLVAPVLAIFLVAPPALGAFTAERESTTVAPPIVAQAPPLPPGDPVAITLQDFAARAVWTDGASLRDRNVEMIGFSLPTADGGWQLVRLALSCCAADAVATKIKMVDAPGVPARDQWVRVVGQWTPGGGTQNERAIPWLRVSTVTPIAAPRDPYE